jgi:hypothetical protein
MAGAASYRTVKKAGGKVRDMSEKIRSKRRSTAQSKKTLQLRLQPTALFNISFLFLSSFIGL